MHSAASNYFFFTDEPCRFSSNKDRNFSSLTRTLIIKTPNLFPQSQLHSSIKTSCPLIFSFFPSIPLPKTDYTSVPSSLFNTKMLLNATSA
ncbi:hypothetical protein VIGAN_02248100 [Vigna angularis var. angularis]|uniref:Uncharacterized protein n=1 Tax=Vigna angularis var. angularis TaxID=157739 RepID=A0A0S3RFV2_PHAAN|nr:hypothetical protein VIGAN_02248100 [Vigna angularis var. angularis]